MEIRVESDHWGEGQPCDIEALLRNVASHLTRYLREPIEGTITVLPTASTEDNPITLYRSTPEEPHIILLQARDRLWSRFSYQFSHELCHVMSNYEHLRDNPNNWFHETICELASVFTLRHMAEKWPTSPPYSNWADYAQALASYASETLSREEHHLPPGMTLVRWLASEEASLRQNPCQRDKNALVAYSLLPIFEKEPVGWNTIRTLPSSSAMLKDYLREWHSQVEPLDRAFVERIIQVFED